MIAENRPLIAVGITMRNAVCQGVAPAPSEPARRWSGTRGERVLGDRVDDRDDREAHHEADDQRVALHVGADAASRAGRGRSAASSARAATASASAAEQRARRTARGPPRRSAPASSRAPPRAAAGSTWRPKTQSTTTAAGREQQEHPAARRAAGAAVEPAHDVARRTRGARPRGRARGASTSAAGDGEERSPGSASARAAARARSGMSCQRCGAAEEDSRHEQRPATSTDASRPATKGASTSAARKPSTTLGRLAISSIGRLDARPRRGAQELAGVDRRQQRERHAEEQRVERRLERAEDQRAQAELGLEVVGAAEDCQTCSGPDVALVPDGAEERAAGSSRGGPASSSQCARCPPAIATMPSSFGARASASTGCRRPRRGARGACGW